MTRMDDKIQLYGDACEMHRDTGTVTDNYGDKTPIWGKVSGGDEYVWIQKRKLGGREPGPAGILDRAPYIGFLKSSTVSQDLDMVVVGSVKYRIEKLNEVSQIRDEVSHYEADLRLVEEG
jgi:hypothetical protein